MKTSLLKFLPPFMAFALLLTACCRPPEPSLAHSNKERERLPSVPEGDAPTLVEGNNAFALDLYRTLSSRDGNLVLSPYSISLALAMTYAGARGETESQMATTLHYTLAPDQLHPAFNSLDLGLSERGSPQVKDAQPMQLDLANAVWAEQTYPFVQDFLDLIAYNYGAGIYLADFIHQYESVRREINGWVSDRTHARIKDLLPEGVLDTDTRMVLVNAIYFKADWDRTFDPNSTSDAPFHLLDGSQASVRMMHDERSGLLYVQGDGYQAIELAYVGETAAMDILLPDEGNFEGFESGLGPARMQEILAAMQPRFVMLGLPKFTFSSDFNLSDTLASMGMPDAFDGDRADFSGMTSRRDLYISNVVHKAFVAVDEKGTEAAAATAVIMGVTSAPMPEVTLTIDRPFIFFIRDTVSGQILFMGRVLNPAAE